MRFRRAYRISRGILTSLQFRCVISPKVFGDLERLFELLCSYKNLCYQFAFPSLTTRWYVHISIRFFFIFHIFFFLHTQKVELDISASHCHNIIFSPTWVLFRRFYQEDNQTSFWEGSSDNWISSKIGVMLFVPYYF